MSIMAKVGKLGAHSSLRISRKNTLIYVKHAFGSVYIVKEVFSTFFSGGSSSGSNHPGNFFHGGAMRSQHYLPLDYN